MNPNEILRKYYGYPSFRPGQGEVVSAILEGRDALAIMPTGAGNLSATRSPLWPWTAWPWSSPPSSP